MHAHPIAWAWLETICGFQTQVSKYTSLLSRACPLPAAGVSRLHRRLHSAGRLNCFSLLPGGDWLPKGSKPGHSGAPVGTPVLHGFWVTHSVKLRFSSAFSLSQYITSLLSLCDQLWIVWCYNWLVPFRVGQERERGLQLRSCVRNLSCLETVLYFLNAVSCSDAGGAICLV